MNPEDPNEPKPHLPPRDGFSDVPPQQAQPMQPNQLPQQHPKTNFMAIFSLVMAFTFAPVGVVTGLIALHQIKKTGEEGRTMALIGFWCSTVFSLLFIAYLALIIWVSFNVGTSGVAQDVEKKTDINAVYAKLEEYWLDNGYYPAEISEETLPSIDPEALKPPVIGAGNEYNYVQYPRGCTECDSYVLSTFLSDGEIYSKESLHATALEELIEIKEGDE